MHRNKISVKPKTKSPKKSGETVQIFKRNTADILKPKGLAGRLVMLLLAVIFFLLAGSYGIASWYIHRHSNEPLKYGTTFIPQYARYYGLDPQETMTALLDDVGFKRFRLVSYWDEIEKDQGIYDFKELDWQFQLAESRHAEVNLAVGLRQPRWPECHMPKWAESMPKDQWYPKLKNFMEAVVNRYKDSPSLISYQVENEFFMTIFGECKDFDRERLVDEYNFVKSLDPNKQIIVTRSNNWGGFPVNAPTPDRYGVAVYKRVWDKTLTKRYFEYPYPPWFYSLLAGMGEIYSGKDMIIHELQMEPWLVEGKGFEMNDVSSMAEQDKSMNADRLKDRFQYAEDTGIRTIDTWGAEWWYWRKVKANDPSLWNVAKEEVHKANKQLQY